MYLTIQDFLFFKTQQHLLEKVLYNCIHLEAFPNQQKLIKK